MQLCDALEASGQLEAQHHAQLVGTLLGTLTQSETPEALADNWQRIATHFDVLLDRPEAVDALEHTILQLAVRGLLVPQDPTDEPASILLQKIRTEKDRLITEKKIRKGKPLPDIGDEEMFFELPGSWAWVRLNSIGDWGAGATPSRTNINYYGGAVPWFKSGELTADHITESEETVTDAALRECSLRLNQPGDVLIAMYGATIGKTSILDVVGTTNQAVCACTPFSGISNSYLLLLMKAYKPYFISQGAGGAQPNISREKIIHTVIGLPPLTEQSRIVTRIEELHALCAELRQRLSAAQSTQGHLADALVAGQTK
jgi:type I restriction enzyme S subunit